MSVSPPPIIHPLIEGRSETADLRWIEFFNEVFQGDAGTSWTPTFTSLTTVGTPTITGRYYRIGQNMCWFNIRIVPGTNTSSTAGTTVCNNLPLTFILDSVCLAGTGSGAVQAIGGIRAADNGIFPPAWTTSTETITVVGFGAAR